MSRADDARAMSLSSWMRSASPDSSSASIANRPRLILGRSGSGRVGRPIVLEFFENDVPVIASQARDAHASAARAFRAVPHPETRSVDRAMRGQDSAVQAKGRLGDRCQPRGRAGVAEVRLDRPDFLGGVVADRREQTSSRPQPVATSPRIA